MRNGENSQQVQNGHMQNGAICLQYTKKEPDISHPPPQLRTFFSQQLSINNHFWAPGNNTLANKLRPGL